MTSFKIPLPSDAEVARRLEIVTPVKQDPPGMWWALDLSTTDPRTASFIYDPPLKPIEPMGNPYFQEYRTVHTFGAPSLYKPSIAEVFAMLPEKTLRGDTITAFAGDPDWGMSAPNCFIKLGDDDFHYASWIAFTTPVVYLDAISPGSFD